LTIGGYPSGNIDRKEVNVDPKNPSTGYGFINSIQNLQSRMVPVEVHTYSSYDDATRTVNIRGIAHSSIRTQNNNLRFSCVLSEDGITGPSPGYDQHNYYGNPANQLGPMGGWENLPDPVPASQMVYNFVARAILGGYDGTEQSIPDTIEANQDFTFDYSYVVPADFNPDSMKAVVFIMDDETGEILNADQVRLRDLTAVPLVPQGKSALYPNPATDIMNLTVDFQTTDPVGMIIYTMDGRMIRNLGNLDLSSGNKSEKIDVTRLPTGSYLLELRHKNSVTALPFTKI
jgi:hypothetical protein